MKCEREREGEREGKIDREREREGKIERERERESKRAFIAHKI